MFILRHHIVILGVHKTRTVYLVLSRLFPLLSSVRICSPPFTLSCPPPLSLSIGYYTHTHTQTNTHASTHTHRDMARKNWRTGPPAWQDTHRRTDTHARTHTHTHTDKHTRKYTHTHSQNMARHHDIWVPWRLSILTDILTDLQHNWCGKDCIHKTQKSANF